MNSKKIQSLPQFKKLSKENQKRVLKALESGRPYLSDNSNDSEKVNNLHYTLKHYGKMQNVISISTSVLDNPICQARQLDKESICYHCFAAAQMNCYKQMQPIFANNLDILCTRLLSDKEIPVILPKSDLFRVESFGDVCNVIQAANYLRIAEMNPWCAVGFWTKNPQFIHAAIQGEFARKAKNVNIVLSSRYVNKVDEIPERYKYFIDRVFTVWNESGITKNSININCGARSCATCRKCYFKSDKVFLINEKLK